MWLCPCRNDLSSLQSFSVAHGFNSAYAFATFQTTFRITAGDAAATVLGCISASITPDLGKTIGSMLTFVPLVILILVGAATMYAGILSPWGSTDVFRWTTNFGRDDDLLRLVTPGFGDCLQYIQFVVLTGALTLNYPGYYQPAVSKASWSILMFNKSFVSHGNGSRSLIDGIYLQNGTYGLEILSRLVGLTADKDIWPGMMVWLLLIVALVVFLVQVGFALRWLVRELSHTQEEDLRRKNMPFTVGNVLRIVYNYFGLPAVTFLMFQFVVAAKSPPYTTGLAALFLIILIGFSVWLFIVVTDKRPRGHLFDELPTMLLFGPFYNTYADGAPSFSLIPLMLTFVRGIAIGAVQPSGIAQIVLLAICEVILILTLHAFRPFQPTTSMNAYHTFFASVRLFATLLSVAFVPSLGVSEGPRGWIGYAILLMHGIVLVFGFFLNALQTIAEVAARNAISGSGDNSTARAGLVKVSRTY
jgi:Transient receptor potential (TRP) ion channel